MSSLTSWLRRAASITRQSAKPISTFAPPSSEPLKSTAEEEPKNLRHGEFVGSLDCGTTSTRFMIFDRYANIVASHQIEFPQYYPEPRQDWHEHDSDQIIESCDACIDQACAELEKLGWTKESVKAIGITNQRETAVVWSRKTGKPLARAIVWDDARTRDIVAHHEKKLREEGIEHEGEVKKGDDAVAALRKLTGLPLSTYFSALKVRWMLDHREEVRKAHDEDDLLFGTVESWIVYRLTGGLKGGVHITDVSNASRTLLMNINTLRFDPILLKFFGFKESILPKVASSSEVYGHIAHGALKGTPIAGLAGDQQAALIGNKCLNPGEAKCTYGTGAFLLFCTGHEAVSSQHGLLTTVAYQNGPGGKPVYCLEGAIGVAGSAVKWLRDSMCMVTSASEVNTLAAKVPNTAGLYFVTAFSGLFAPYWDTTATGMIIGMTSYTTPAHVARATLEANAYMTRAVLDSMKSDTGIALKELKVDGGMTNGDMVMSILADLGGADVVRPEMRESTALGSALLAGSAIRLFGWDISDPETLREVNTAGSQTFKPTMSQEERDKKWRGWQRAVERSRGWTEIEEE
ncbi:glycerol kinase [Irpex rosettiformis]|uniref:Glycerol kinase n=1 Tax=Irpex rosettiformis TaxID=378272 RepID=A0ACB8TP72_9APHY|nr:glycerol kinase [Irpex rosettiformis]